MDGVFVSYHPTLTTFMFTGVHMLRLLFIQGVGISFFDIPCMARCLAKKLKGRKLRWIWLRFSDPVQLYVFWEEYVLLFICDKIEYYKYWDYDNCLLTIAYTFFWNRLKVKVFFICLATLVTMIAVFGNPRSNNGYI